MECVAVGIGEPWQDHPGKLDHRCSEWLGRSGTVAGGDRGESPVLGHERHVLDKSFW
jgi:hypothetical protein